MMKKSCFFFLGFEITLPLSLSLSLSYACIIWWKLAWLVMRSTRNADCVHVGFVHGVHRTLSVSVEVTNLSAKHGLANRMARRCYKQRQRLL